MLRTHCCSVNCILPPHILKELLKSSDSGLRETALNTILTTTSLRAERKLIASVGFVVNAAGGRRRTIYDCRSRRILESARRIRGESDGPTSDPSVNRAYDALGVTYDFFKEVFDRNSIDGRGMRLDGYVHFARLYNNAFWNGCQMVFGDGDGRLFTDFTGSIEVIAHELTHGVTETTAGLEYRGQPGALNESMSDVFGSLTKQWHLGQTAEQADWLIGREIFTPDIDADALRSMKDPGHAYDSKIIGKDPQPAHMDDYVEWPETEEGDWGGVHINSGIPNHAFYLVATCIGDHAWEAPGHIWYEALRASSATTDFQEFADRTYTTAGVLYGTNSMQQQAVQRGWGEVGIRVYEKVKAAALVRGNGRRLAQSQAAAVPTAAVAEGKQPVGLGNQLEKVLKELGMLRKEIEQIKKQGGVAVVSR